MRSPREAAGSLVCLLRDADEARCHPGRDHTSHPAGQTRRNDGYIHAVSLLLSF